MKKDFSSSWKRSVLPRKQRKFRYNAPLHLKQKMLHVHLLPLLRKKYHLRNVQVRVGDKVKVLRGQFAKKEGKVERVNLKREKVLVTGVEIIKKEGTKVLFPISPSNLMILELNLDDQRRREKIEFKLKSAKEPKENKTSENKK